MKKSPKSPEAWTRGICVKPVLCVSCVTSTFAGAGNHSESSATADPAASVLSLIFRPTSKQAVCQTRHDDFAIPEKVRNELVEPLSSLPQTLLSSGLFFSGTIKMVSRKKEPDDRLN
jgi:hypothetical protein